MIYCKKKEDIMLKLVPYLIITILLGATIYKPNVYGILFMGLYIVFTVYCLLITKKQKNIDKEKWTAYEAELISKYYYALTVNLGVRYLSFLLNTLRIFSIAWLIIFIVTGIWYMLPVLIILFFIASVPVERLDPFTLLETGSFNRPDIAKKYHALKLVYEKFNPVMGDNFVDIERNEEICSIINNKLNEHNVGNIDIDSAIDTIIDEYNSAAYKIPLEDYLDWYIEYQLDEADNVT
jgi:hypothetical protein